MKLHFLLAPVGLLAALGCSTQATYTVPTPSKGAPAAVSTFGFLDILAIVPTNLGTSYPACMTPTVAANKVTLVLAGCPAGSGGTESGTIAITTTPGTGGATDYAETFSALTTTQSPTLMWSLTGEVDVTVNGTAASMTAAPGFHLSVTDTGTPANTKVWTFTCGLTSTGPVGNLTVQGSYEFKSSAGDDITVAVDAGSPLVWNGGRYPVSGTLHISDTVAGATTPQTVDAVFSPGSVSIGGGVVTLQ